MQRAKERGVAMFRGLIAAAVAAFVLAFVATSNYWLPIYEPIHDIEQVLPAARELAALSRSDDLVVMLGRGWDPDVLYYARRKGLLLFNENASDELFATLPSQPYRIVFSMDPQKDAIRILRLWAWSGAVGPRTYEVGADPRALEHSTVLATDDRSAFDAAAAGSRRLLSSAIDVPCDGAGRSLAVDPLGAWLLVHTDAETRVSLSALGAPLPARAVYVIAPQAMLGRSSVTMSCIGVGSMTIDAMIAAPPPDR